MLSGLGLLFGNIGALTAQVPLRLAIERFGWRGVVLASSGVIIGVFVLTWIVVKDDPSERNFQTYARHFCNAKTLRAIASVRRVRADL